MITSILLTLAIGATYTVDGIDLAKGEAAWLLRARIAYEQQMLDILTQDEFISDNVEDARAELATLPNGPLKTAITKAVAAADAGEAARAQIANRRLDKIFQARPSGGDARKQTIARIYDRVDGAFSQDLNEDGRMSRAEARWPALIFDAVDKNADGAISLTEMATYWDAL